MAAFVARGSEPTADEAERSGEGGFGGFLSTTIQETFDETVNGRVRCPRQRVHRR
jgi:hypothetical protein